MAFFNTHFATSLLVSLITLSVVTAHITPTPAPVSASHISSSPKVLPNGPSSNYLPFDAMEDGLVSIPMDEQAKDSQFLEAYMAKAANEIEQFMINVVEKKLKDPETEQTTKECLDICAEVYDQAVDALRKGMEDIDGRDFSKAASDVGAFKNNLDTCDDCLGDMMDDEFNKIDNWARGVGNDCLDKITKYTSNPKTMAFFNTHFATSLLVSLITLSVATAHIAPAPTPKGSARTPAPAPTTHVSSTPKGSPSPAPSSSYSIVLPSAASPNSLPLDALQAGLSSIPMDEQAKDLKFLGAHMSKAADEIEQFLINVVEKAIKDPNTEQSSKECLDICAEVYDLAVEALRKGMEDIDGSDFLKAQMDVVAFKGNVDTCDDCLGDMVDSEIQKMDDWARGVGNDCLDKITKYTPNPVLE
ncbi:hypothetical protein ACJIZ3_021704 [Penstemon smallii]|uniref:Pectinesterase inhibitor domain-containing protein n=1 Tax=Penstemon smallii TaxID=265156 RepID=A0ABD3SMF5_9LAMI